MQYLMVLWIILWYLTFSEFLGWILFLHLNPKKIQGKQLIDWKVCIMIHLILISCFKFFLLLISITQIWIFRILSDMRTLSADWMANTNKSESELQSSQHGGEESKANIFYPRAVAPTAAQVFIIFHSLAGPVI